MIAFNSIILGLEGNTGVAAYGVIANISLVVTAVYTGISQGIQPLVSTAHGQGPSRSDPPVPALCPDHPSWSCPPPSTSCCSSLPDRWP